MKINLFNKRKFKVNTNKNQIVLNQPKNKQVYQINIKLK